MVHGMWDLVNGAAPTSSMLGDLKRARTFFERTNFQTMTNASAYRSGRTQYARKNTTYVLELCSAVLLTAVDAYPYQQLCSIPKFHLDVHDDCIHRRPVRYNSP
jgi:hypothetical protein